MAWRGMAWHEQGTKVQTGIAAQASGARQRQGKERLEMRPDGATSGGLLDSTQLRTMYCWCAGKSPM